ncbi:T7SS effector LXG polymorphic toxin [Enterococcus termitis]|uniref:T7SS effector LXG polymorphic toxin n=1 Tax=Enterococcus termitis TaxID=332950 RepID=UPI0009F5CEAB|nr:T7SS effector LXG polymorphic toxin [Enterococcus termitis]
MGLIYSSSDSSQLISALQKNIQSGKEASEQLKSGSQQVIAAVDGKTLSGAAYKAGKGLFSDLIVPTISKVTSAIDSIESELQTYSSADALVSGEGTLDEDKLRQQNSHEKNDESVC